MSKTTCLLVGVLLCLGAASAAIAQSAPENLSSPVFSSLGRFCRNGVVESLPWELAEQGQNLTIWGSVCGDAPLTGEVKSTRFLAPRNLSLFLTGFIGSSPSMRLALRNMLDGREIELRPHTVPSYHWQRNDFPVPADWVGKPVQIVGEQDIVPESNWFGFTAPVLPYSSVAIGMIATNRPQAGFCYGGIFPPSPWDSAAPPPGSVLWRSYCDSGDDNTGWLASRAFTADLT